MKCSHAVIVLVVAAALLAGFAGCRVQEKGEGEKKKVDIQTPVGSLHVDKSVDVRDTGLAIYPDATPARDEDSQHGANVNIESNLFGVRIVAVKYRSADPPEKLLDFYRKQLKSFGDVSECRGSMTLEHGKMHCGKGKSGNEIDLVAGPEDRQHIVSVEPKGKGSEFSLVYVQTRGGKETM